MTDSEGSSGSRLPLPIRPRPPLKMSSPSRQRSPAKAGVSMTTPRRSSSHQPNNNNNNNNTRQSEAQTPATNPRASAPPSSTTRFSIRTPGNQVVDFRSSRQPLSASGRKGGNAVPTQFTPHGRAAIRALDSRRAAINEINTPGRNRRRSMRDQRETPRDILRALSKTLAPKSKAISTSSSSSPDDRNGNNAPRGNRGRGRRGSKRGAAPTIPEDPDDSDEFPIDRPRFSLPIDEEEADSDGDLPRPPRTSGLEDLEDNFTMQSIEMPRRATLSQQQRYSMRMSDYGPMNDPPSDDDVGIDSAFFPRANWDEDNTGDGTGMGMGMGDDATFERLDDEAARRETLGLEGRISDFGAIDVNLDAGDQSTVVLAPEVQSSPAREGFSPENEPFGFAMDDEPLPPPEEMEVEDDDNAQLGLGGGDEGDLELGDLDAEAVIARRTAKSVRKAKRSGKKISRYGIEYPSLPQGVVKRLAQRFAGKTKISPDSLAAIMQASDWFFEQLGDDLQAFAKHAGRKTIDESDMLTLMRRQRQTSAAATPFALAQRHLPRELLQELRVPLPVPTKMKHRRAANPAGEDEDVR